MQFIIERRLYKYDRQKSNTTYFFNEICRLYYFTVHVYLLTRKINVYTALKRNQQQFLLLVYIDRNSTFYWIVGNS